MSSSTSIFPTLSADKVKGHRVSRAGQAGSGRFAHRAALRREARQQSYYWIAFERNGPLCEGNGTDSRRSPTTGSPVTPALRLDHDDERSDDGSREILE